MKGSIQFAIEHKRLISLCYKDMFRIVEPYVLGLHWNGQQVLYCYQTGGESLTKEMGWRDFYLYSVYDVVVLPRSFKNIRCGYQLFKDNLDLIYCAVSD